MKETLRTLFRRASAEELMQRELDEARKALLEALSGRDYAEALVQYHSSRIDRLRSMLAQDAAVMAVGGTE